MHKKCVGGVAGRSGGHIIPCVTHLAASIAHDHNYEILLFSTTTDLDRSILALYPSITYIPLTLDPFPGKKIVRYPAFFIQCIRSFTTSLRTLRKKRVERLVSTGGYLSLPVCAAAWCLGIPIEGYELNAVPGKALKWLAPYARTLNVCFDEAAPFFKPYPCKTVRYPLRFNESHRLPQKEGLRHYGLDPHKKTLLIVGGSQGSQSINELIKTFITNHPEKALDLQVIHQAGAGKSTDLQAFYHEKGFTARVFDYEHSLQYAYAAAEYVIARAGAGTLFELEFFNKKTLLIPLESSSTLHQLDNARAFISRDPVLFSLLRQSDVLKNPEVFAQHILQHLEL